MNSKRGGKSRRNRFHDKKRYEGPKDSTSTAKREYRQYDQLSEKDVGITQFVSDLTGFSGIIKARFSDFHVNEIDLNGVVAILDNTKIPKMEGEAIDPDTIVDTPVANMTDSKWKEIKEMMGDKSSKETITMDVTELTKDDRKAIHLKMKDIYRTKIIASTIVEGEKKTLTFRRRTANDGNEADRWPENLGEYVHFLLYKESTDTLTAIYDIARVVGVPPSVFSYAGLKDKRAKTTQWVSVRRVPPWKLIMKCNKLRNVKVGNIKFESNPLKLGDLKGNQFKIALRNVITEESVIKEAIENVEKNGFINYYGLQRFGNDKEVPTYLIGKNLLLGNWKEACDQILQLKPSDDPLSDILAVKKKYQETGSAQEALKCFKRNRNSCVESKLLEGLEKGNQNDYVNALENVPRNMRLLYIHSIQSLIWNIVVSKRIEKYGFKPVEGDFVLVNGSCLDQEKVLEDENEKQSDKSESSTEDDEDKEDKSTDKEMALASKPEIKVLTSSDLEQYSIFDVVLPLPGYDIQYPANLVEFYQTELEKHGLSLEMPQQKVKTYNLSGSYRKMMLKIEDLKWKTMKYNDPIGTLIQSEWEKKNNFNVPENVEDGKFKAVILEFNLNSSAYATMVLREIMKVETSTSAQAKLNDYAKPEIKKIDMTEQKVEEEMPTIENNPSSLLNDWKKMEEFKTSVLNDVMKRKHEVEEHQEAKKLKQSEVT